MFNPFDVLFEESEPVSESRSESERSVRPLSYAYDGDEFVKCVRKKNRKRAGVLIWRKKAGKIEVLMVKGKGSTYRFERGGKVEEIYCRGKYGPPKGETENGESSMECALREFKEEAGYVVKDTRNMEKYSFKCVYKKKNETVEDVMYVTHISNVCQETSEISGEIVEVSWLDWEQLRSYDINAVAHKLRSLRINFN